MSTNTSHTDVFVVMDQDGYNALPVGTEFLAMAGTISEMPAVKIRDADGLHPSLLLTECDDYAAYNAGKFRPLVILNPELLDTSHAFGLGDRVVVAKDRLWSGGVGSNREVVGVIAFLADCNGDLGVRADWDEEGYAYNRNVLPNSLTKAPPEPEPEVLPTPAVAHRVALALLGGVDEEEPLARGRCELCDMLTNPGSEPFSFAEDDTPKVVDATNSQSHVTARVAEEEPAPTRIVVTGALTHSRYELLVEPSYMGGGGVFFQLLTGEEVYRSIQLDADAARKVHATLGAIINATETERG